jgi:hypothetical protein
MTRDRRSVLLGYGAIGSICVIWLAGWGTWPAAWPSNANFFITAMLLVAAVKWLKLYGAARRYGRDRRDGNLELLLTTPARPQDILEGTLAGLTRQFRPLEFTVLALLVLMMLGGFSLRPWNVRAALTYAAVWCALGAWCLSRSRGQVLSVIWAAVNTGRPGYAVFWKRRNSWSWGIWAYFSLRNVLSSGLVGRPAGGVPLRLGDGVRGRGRHGHAGVSVLLRPSTGSARIGS